MSDTLQKRRWPRWVILAPLILVGVFSSRWLGEMMPACLFHGKTGLLCPGCGATRASVALSQGQWSEALQSNGLFVIGVVGGLVLILLGAIQRRYSEVKWLEPFRWRLWYLWGVLASLVVFGVLRNVPGMEWMGPKVSYLMIY